MPATYQFRREDNDEIVEVSFEAMMAMDVCSRITLPDGATARRVREPSHAAEKIRELDKPLVSDSLGFIEQQLPHFEDDRIRHGFKGVEFVRDPDVPQFIRAKFNSKSEWERYVRHRGMVDKNSRNGSASAPTEREIKDLRVRILEQYPLQENFRKSETATVDDAPRSGKTGN